MKTITYRRITILLRLFTFFLLFPFTIHATIEREENNISFACTGTVIDTFPYTESFETGNFDFTQNTDDDGDWTRDNNGTPSNNTGPDDASDGNFYLFTEASTSGQGAMGFNASAILTSPCFDFTGVGGATFNFDYHMYGNAIGQISVEVSDDGGVNWNVLQVISGQQQTSGSAPWITSSINLNAYVGNTINVRIVGTTGSSFSGDMAIDNVEVTVTPVNPEINITGLGNDIVSGDVTPTVADGTDFGDITLGLSNSSTFFIENSGILELLLTDPNPYITITGTNAGDFSIATIPTTPIAPVNGSTPFAIGFTPSAIGDRFATISIASNDSDENPYVFDIMGTGVAPSSEINVSGLGNAIMSGDVIPSVFDGTDFGFTTLGTSVSSDFVIINSGLLGLDLTNASPYVNLIGADASQFSISVIPNNTISNNGGTTQFQITYTPVSVGVHTVTVSIVNNDPDENPFVFDITGEAVVTFVPEIEITGNAVEIVNGDMIPDVSDATDYGTISLGTKKNVAFTINNVGSGALTLSGPPPYLTITGTDASQFSIQTEPSSSIAASAATVFQIQYNPFGLGTHTATVTVVSDDSDEPNYSFTITGTAIENENPLETPYYANFDTSDDNWVASNPGGGSIWTHGTNAVEVGTEGDYWYTDTYDDYASNSDTYVTSPIIDLSGYQNLTFKIDIRYDTDGDTGGDDGMNIEYSPDGGATWFVLGAYADPQVDNWYNGDNVDALGNGIDGWAGFSFDIVSATKSDFIQASVDLPVELVNNPVARFRVHFASDNSQNDNGVNFDNVFVLGDPIVSDDPIEGPAGVYTNLKLWLKTTEGVGGASNAGQLAAWEDQALDNNATRGDSGQQPIYYDDINENINYNPVVSFNDVIDSELKGKGGFNTQDYWIVMQADGSVNSSSPIKGVIAGRVSRDQFSEDGTGLWINPGSLRFSGVDNIVSHMVGATSASASDIGDGSYGRAYTSSTDSYDNEPIILNVKVNNAGDQTEIYKNGIRIDNYTGKTTGSPSEDLPYINVTNSSYILGVGRITVGGTNYDSHFNGKMSEVISYANPLTIFDQEKIQSYLAIKYGITLHDTNSTSITRLGDQNYIDSDGSTIWNVAAHTGYNYDIAGIGRDITSGLNQKQSISVNSGAIVTMGLTEVYNTNNENIANNTNTIVDKNFLMWGNDNKSLNAAASIIVDLSDGIAGLNTVVDITSVERSWKVVETGTVGRVKVSVPEIALSATLDPPGSFFMFISDTPTFNPSSEYRIMLPNGDNVEAEYDFEGTKYITFGYAPDYVFDRSITFNGTTDYMDAQDYLDIEGDFTISTWIKHSSQDYTVLSKNDPAFNEGYELKINTDRTVSMIWKNGSTQSITSSTQIPNNEWHQIAVSYDGSSASLYIDGVLDVQAPLTAPVTNNEKFLIAAGRGSTPADFYEGTIDEVRVWDAALTANQIRFIMNQEILENTNLMVMGEIIPATISKNDIDAIPWDSLDGYFPMTTYAFTNVKGASNNTVVAAIKNLKTVDFQTAPLPYVSQANGNWTNPATWENGTGFQIPNATSIVDNTVRVDWNIVQTAHNVTTQENNTVLALDVQTDELSIENDSKIEVSHYLKLDGVLDLVGESQLIQTENSDLDATSTGSLEKDQQGTADTYSYNIWAAPVSTINGTQINTNYTVASMMKDGTNPNNPLNMSFTGGLNGAATTPITISSFWMFKYGNGIEQFQPIGSTGNVSVGEGYTMKGPGSGAITDPQNYVFVGKPNNSTDAEEIIVPAIADRDYMVGNPFPSALDANDFINDNPHLDGTLYF
ncbi:choice-of-anchor D domain-containing protein, partial [Dokdonia pacifica]